MDSEISDPDKEVHGHQGAALGDLGEDEHGLDAKEHLEFAVLKAVQLVLEGAALRRTMAAETSRLAMKMLTMDETSGSTGAVRPTPSFE